jgi:hypothetical protein
VDRLDDQWAESDATIIDLTPEPVKTIGEWSSYCYDTAVDTWGVGDEAFKARWTLTKSTAGTGIWLNGGSKLSLVANDDFTDLVAHRVSAQGYKRGPGLMY